MNFALLAGNIAPIMAVVSILLAGGVLLQTRGAGQAAFSESNQSTFSTRRGGELFVFRGTLVLGAIFIILSVIALIT
ncbi:MAG: preprotein translocase subunit SecG [Patescibacteria group bacterium]